MYKAVLVNERERMYAYVCACLTGLKLFTRTREKKKKRRIVSMMLLMTMIAWISHSIFVKFN